MSAAMESAIDHLLKAAKSKSVDCEILANQSDSTGISFQGGKVDQFSFSQTHQIGVRVVDGRREGLAFSESLEKASLDEMLTEALANARMIEKGWASDLEAKGEAKTIAGLYDESLRQVSVEAKMAAAQTLESAAMNLDPAISSVAYSKYADVLASVWIANTGGLRASYQQTACSAYAHCLAKDGDAGVMAGETRIVRRFGDLNSKAVAETAARKTLERRGAVRPATGKYPVVFENRCAEKLFGLIGDYFSAKSVDEGNSPLKGRLGEKVFSEKLNLLDDPFFLAASSCRPFDDEGFPSTKTSLVENGVLRSFLTNSALARKMKLAHTASASRSPSTDLGVSPTNLLVRPGKTKAQDLLASAKTVISITGILGAAGFRSTSGDFSLPVEGFLYENGHRVRPLKDFLISGNIIQLFAAVEAVADDVQPAAGRVVSPSLLVSEVNVSGQS